MMGTFFVYMLKTAVCLALFYLFYRLLLSRETFHRFNRIALLSILLLSLLIPFIEVSFTQQTEVQQTMLTLEMWLLMVNEGGGQQVEGGAALWIQIALLSYVVGFVFFACRHLNSLIQMLRLFRKGRREKSGQDTVLIVHQQEIAPFSWVKYIVISEKDLAENGREILIHEQAHIRNRHSIDLLLADICLFFQWFNPAAWLLKQELQNIHEYEADETVIKEGVDAKQYQLLLIKKAVGTRLYSMANSFNHSKLKKRITMMLKEKSSPWARLKYLYVLPLAAIAVTAFARPEVSNKVEEISAVKVNDLTAMVETKWQETRVEMPKEIVKQLSGRVKVMHVKKQDRILESDSLEKKRNVQVAPSIETKKPLVIVDGVELGVNVMHALHPDCIQLMSVLKGPAALAAYGEKGKNGVIVITLKSEAEYREQNVKNQITSVQHSVQKNGEKATYYVDGKQVSIEVAQSIGTDNIDRIEVLKENGEGGSVLIITKKQTPGK